MNTSIVFFLNQKHDASRHCVQYFPKQRYLESFLYPFRMDINKKVSKHSFIRSFLSFLYRPPVLPSNESKLRVELEWPFIISKVCGSQSLLDLHGNQWCISEQRSSGIKRNPTISITGRNKSPRLGKPSGWSMLPK